MAHPTMARLFLNLMALPLGFNVRGMLSKVVCLTMVALILASPLKAEVSNQTLAVLVNINDPESIEIAKYYQKVRLIPESNIIYLNFKRDVSSLSQSEFHKIEMQLKNKVPDHIQAYALAWRKPWKVDCMSITSAISMGFDERYCAKTCKLTKASKYFNSSSDSPYSDFKIRPSIMLSANSVSGVKKLITRGKESDFTRPIGTAYLLSTYDKQRNVRSVSYPQIEKLFNNIFNTRSIKSDAIQNKTDVMFYFTGTKHVRWVGENKYLPGAIADHLTSSGGHLFGGEQMSVLKWIDAGVTGTYGTVVEPCNFKQKFPNPAIVMHKYLSGETLLESYWKSVKMPGQGVFVGEPLASPYKNCKLPINSMVNSLRQPADNFVEKKHQNCF